MFLCQLNMQDLSFTDPYKQPMRDDKQIHILPNWWILMGFFLTAIMNILTGPISSAIADDVEKKLKRIYIIFFLHVNPCELMWDVHGAVHSE